ncbi:MAG: glycosyltransferase [Bacteroidaceae bacterium]|nr:glycosyltransferase [Bacteroidaceae bacterium]
MRILHVITSLRTGGAEKLMVDLLPRLHDFGHDVELCLFDGIRSPFYEELEKQGVKIHSFQTGGSVYNPLHIFRLISLIKQFDVVHTHNTAPQLFVALAHIVSPKCFLFTTEHNTTNRRRNIKGLVYIDKWMYSQYKKIICISDQAEANLRSYLHNSSDKICTVYNGVDIQKYMNAEPIFELREKYKDCHLGIMVAGFREQKDQKTLIRAYNCLPENYHLLFAGSGILEEECKQLTKKLGLASRIHFLGNRTDIPQLLHTADIVIMSSHYEGLSLSSIEGMACGKPFIASDVDGLREIVQGFGILVPHEDEKTLANEIQKACTDMSYREKIISLCQEKTKSYDISLMAKNYNLLYTE